MGAVLKIKPVGALGFNTIETSAQKPQSTECSPGNSQNGARGINMSLQSTRNADNRKRPLVHHRVENSYFF